MSFILSGHYGGMLNIISAGNCEKYTNSWRLHNTHLGDARVKEEIRMEMKNS